jgi:hypothetical protein
VSNPKGTNVTITTQDIIHRPVFYLKHDVSETRLSLFLGRTYSDWPNRKSKSLSPDGDRIQSPKRRVFK